MDSAPVSVCLQTLLPSNDAARPVSSVKGSRLKPVQRSSVEKLPGAGAVPEAQEAGISAAEALTERQQESSRRCPASQPAAPAVSAFTHSQLTVHTLLPEAVIEDSLAALETYYGIPGCTHSSQTMVAAADPSTGVPPGTHRRASQQQYTSWYNLPRLKTVSLSLPSAAPGAHRTFRLEHNPASQQPPLCPSRCDMGHYSRQHGAPTSAALVTAAAPYATTTFMAHLRYMGTSAIQPPARTGHKVLTMPDSMSKPLQPQLEQLRQANLMSTATVHVDRTTAAFNPAAATHCSRLQQPAGHVCNSSTVFSGQLVASKRLLTTVNNSSFQGDVDQCSSSPIVLPHTAAALTYASSTDGLAQASSSFKLQSSSQDVNVLSRQDRKAGIDVPQVATNVAKLLQIKLDQTAGGALLKLEDILQDSPHLSSTSVSTGSKEHVVQQAASSPAATGTPAGSFKLGVSQQLRLSVGAFLPVSPRAARQPILIDSPRPVGSPRSPRSPGAADSLGTMKQAPAVASQQAQQQKRSPGSFVGHKPNRVLVAGGVGPRNCVCSCTGSSVLSDSGGSGSGASGSVQLVRPHAACLIADAAAAGAAEIGGLLQHVLKLEPKEYAGPSIALAPWKHDPVVVEMIVSSRAEVEQASGGDELTAWKQPW